MDMLESISNVTQVFKADTFEKAIKPLAKIEANLRRVSEEQLGKALEHNKKSNELLVKRDEAEAESAKSLKVALKLAALFRADV